ncbi:MAG: glycosyltransferase family 39 protein [Deltaproteobacteria bacterium]|nr:glycosyltransferase family 39 protein [Deltaproteobacteria bacterium]
MKTTSKITYFIFPLLLFIAAGAIYLQINHHKKVIFLSPEKGAHWIKYDRPYWLGSHRHEEQLVIFRKNFTLNKEISHIKLKLRALKSARLFLDGQLIYETPINYSNWRKTQSLKIEKITSGKHTLHAFISNQDGPPLLLAYSENFKLFTDRSWETMRPDNSWQPAVLIEENRSASISKQFSPVKNAFWETLPYGLVIFITSFIFSVAYYYRQLPGFSYFEKALSLSKLRWLLIIAWITLSISSLIKYPLAGFDYPAHIDYINYVASKWSIPLASEGWQMFQSPLYYIISSLFLKICLSFFSEATSYQLLKVIPLLCGLIQVEVVYRTMKITFPKKKYVQATGLIVGSLMPMNLYMSQYIGNEPMAALFSSLVILLILQSIRNPWKAQSPKHQLLTGLFLGLAILTKVSALLLPVPVLLVFLGLNIQKGRGNLKKSLWTALNIIMPLFIIAGWYYVRNMVLLGKPFIGGWDPARGISWWQDPGYRIISDLTTFGTALAYPVFSGTSGLWDAIYSTLWLDGFLGSVADYRGKPPWNYSFVLTLSWLSLLPTIAMLTGFFSIMKKREREDQFILLISTLLLILYFGAIIYLYIQLPIYSTAKASYTLGLIPCYAILCGFGLELLSRGVILRSAVVGLISWWGIFAFAAYFPV